MSLEILESTSGKVTILKTKGFIDTSTATVLEESIKKAIGAGKMNLVIDLAESDFISSAGWGVFVAYLRKIREAGGDIKLAAMIEKVYKVFKLLEFDALIDAFPTVDEAVKSYGS